MTHDNAPTKTPSQLERGINAPSRDHAEYIDWQNEQRLTGRARMFGGLDEDGM